MDIFDQASYVEEGRVEKQAEIDTLRTELTAACEETARLREAVDLLCKAAHHLRPYSDCKECWKSPTRDKHEAAMDAEIRRLEGIIAKQEEEIYQLRKTRGEALDRLARIEESKANAALLSLLSDGGKE